MATFSINFKSLVRVSLSSSFGIAALGNVNINSFDAYLYSAHNKLETAVNETRVGLYLAIGF